MLSCVVVDTETTGIRAAENRVIEVGAVRILDGDIVDRFETLIDPGVTVPRRITRLTGIRTSDLVGAPRPGEAWSRFRSFAGESVLVAHNARFDRAFIETELGRLGLDPLPGAWLCTVRLSRRLLPGLPSRRLDAVARFLSIPVGVRHRALADAEITANVVMELYSRARAGGVTDAEGLVTLQGVRYATARVVEANAERIRRDVLPGLPPTPGVYRMLDAAGRVLYVGKATSLRDRVGSYFTAVEAKPVRLRELVRKVDSIAVLETPTEIEARIREARLIRELQPRYNRAQLEPGRRAWVRLNEPDRTVDIHRFRGRDEALWIGPLSGLSDARGVAEVSGALLGFTVGRRRARSSAERIAEERLEAAAARLRAEIVERLPFTGVTTGSIRDAARDPITIAMTRAADELAFEEARTLRDWLETVERLAAARVNRGPVRGDSVFVAERGSSTEFVLVRDGAFVGSLDSGDRVEERVRAWLQTLEADRYGSRVLPVRDPAAVRALEDERWMLLRWSEVAGAAVVRRAEDESVGEFGARVAARACGVGEGGNADSTDSPAAGRASRTVRP